MKCDIVIAAHGFAGLRDFARWAESIGHDGLWSIETAEMYGEPNAEGLNTLRLMDVDIYPARR